jgi:hypothetical protein
MSICLLQVLFKIVVETLTIGTELVMKKLINTVSMPYQREIHHIWWDLAARDTERNHVQETTQCGIEN